MNPVLRELQRQLNDIAKQLDDLQRQETLGGGGSFGSKFAVVGTSQDIASFEVDGTYARVYFVSYRDSALTHGEFKGRASRGSKDSPAAIQSGDLIFAIRAEGYGTDAWPGGVTSEVSLEADGNHTNTSQPGRIVFKTAQSGATGSTEAMRIDATQQVSFAGNVILSSASKMRLGRVGASIASGAITYAATYMEIDTEGLAATDDLDTISGGTDGNIIILKTLNATRDITIKNGTGNINCGADRVLNTNRDTWMGIYNGVAGFWMQLSFSDNT